MKIKKHAKRVGSGGQNVETCAHFHTGGPLHSKYSEAAEIPDVENALSMTTFAGKYDCKQRKWKGGKCISLH